MQSFLLNLSISESVIPPQHLYQWQILQNKNQHLHQLANLIVKFTSKTNAEPKREAPKGAFSVEVAATVIQKNPCGFPEPSNFPVLSRTTHFEQLLKISSLFKILEAFYDFARTFVRQQYRQRRCAHQPRRCLAGKNTSLRSDYCRLYSVITFFEDCIFASGYGDTEFIL